MNMNTPHDDAKDAEIRTSQEQRSKDEDRYTMRISRRTVDKLGVKLYDRASAVVAELVANAYDADAESVRVRLPLASLLGNEPSARQAAEETEEQGNAASDEEAETLGQNEESYKQEENENVTDQARVAPSIQMIEVSDNGHGMDPTEAENNFLTVGQDRRTNIRQGALSRSKKRPVMGRKGIGKLAPFGICRRMEVLSSGGEKTADGFITSHFILDYDEIIQDTEKPYYPQRGGKDRTHSTTSGTIIRLSEFQRKRVPNEETFLRQLARRFGAQQSDFRIVVEDLRGSKGKQPVEVKPINIPVEQKTRIDLNGRPVPLEDGRILPITGWIGMAKEGYKHEELAGVRIYARNKIVATTRDFGLMSGFTGENTLRSYLVGEIHAEWLDEDSGEDLIKTDRQDILWESDRGQALRSWGHDLLKEIGTLTRKPRRENVRKRFLRLARVAERANERYPDTTIVESALDLANMIGGFAAEDELTDESYVDGLCEVILSVAPHRALMEAFRGFKERVDGEAPALESLLDLFDKTRVAELASYAQIAMERVTIIEKLSDVVNDSAPEPELQRLISKGPWLIDPAWSVITSNQALRTFAQRFAMLWHSKHGEDLVVDIGEGLGEERKRPDFTAMEVGGRLHVVEIKAPGHKFNGKDFERLQNYVTALRKFFEKNRMVRESFSKNWEIDLVVDEVAITNTTQQEAFARFEEKGEVVRSTWIDFITRAQQANSEYLKARSASKQEADRLAASGQ